MNKREQSLLEHRLLALIELCDEMMDTRPEEEADPEHSDRIALVDEIRSSLLILWHDLRLGSETAQADQFPSTLDDL